MVSNLLGLKKEKEIEKEKTKAVTISPQYSVLFFFLGRKNHSVAIICFYCSNFNQYTSTTSYSSTC